MNAILLTEVNEFSYSTYTADVYKCKAKLVFNT